jgi:hypothetical protein
MTPINFEIKINVSPFANISTNLMLINSSPNGHVNFHNGNPNLLENLVVKNVPPITKYIMRRMVSPLKDLGHENHMNLGCM